MSSNRLIIVNFVDLFFVLSLLCCFFLFIMLNIFALQCLSVHMSFFLFFFYHKDISRTYDSKSYLYLALVSLVIPESVWILRRQCQSQGGLLSNKNGLFVILQFTENDENFF